MGDGSDVAVAFGASATLDTDLRHPHECFPLARKLNRRIFLHTGPTNSGKTHAAVEALKRAENGVFCGPLRLLAWEMFQKLNAHGVPCSLLTGQEKQQVRNSQKVARRVFVVSPMLLRARGIATTTTTTLTIWRCPPRFVCVVACVCDNNTPGERRPRRRCGAHFVHGGDVTNDRTVRRGGNRRDPNDRRRRPWLGVDARVLGLPGGRSSSLWRPVNWFVVHHGSVCVCVCVCVDERTCTSQLSECSSLFFCFGGDGVAVWWWQR